MKDGWLSRGRVRASFHWVNTGQVGGFAHKWASLRMSLEALKSSARLELEAEKANGAEKNAIILALLTAASRAEAARSRSHRDGLLPAIIGSVTLDVQKGNGVRENVYHRQT